LILIIKVIVINDELLHLCLRTIQDPCKLMLLWDKKPQNVLVTKKIWDDKVDEAFVELVAWLVQVSIIDTYMFSLHFFL